MICWRNDSYMFLWDSNAISAEFMPYLCRPSISCIWVAVTKMLSFKDEVGQF